MHIRQDLDRGRGRQIRRENGVLCPCTEMPRHFDVVFDVRVLDLNLSIVAIRKTRMMIELLNTLMCISKSSMHSQLDVIN